MILDFCGTCFFSFLLLCLLLRTKMLYLKTYSAINLVLILILMIKSQCFVHSLFLLLPGGQKISNRRFFSKPSVVRFLKGHLFQPTGLCRPACTYTYCLLAVIQPVTYTLTVCSMNQTKSFKLTRNSRSFCCFSPVTLLFSLVLMRSSPQFTPSRANPHLYTLYAVWTHLYALTAWLFLTFDSRFKIQDSILYCHINITDWNLS